MKFYTRTQSLLVLALSLFLLSCGGKTINGEKNIREIYIEHVLPFDKETVWEGIFMDFGNVYKFSPSMKNSGYFGESKTVIVGAERFIENTDGSRVYERLIEFDPELKKMRFKVFDAKDVPIDTDVSFGESTLEEIGPNKTRFKMKFQYRTSPRILAVFANGSIKEDLENMAIGMEHYLTTNEVVTEENFDKISALYRKSE